MQNAEVNPFAKRKLVRRAVSVAVALLQIAVTIPNLMGFGEFVYIMCVFGIPCLGVCIFAGRNKVVEAIGWALQILLLIIMLLPNL
jgi:hypothetical protein